MAEIATPRGTAALPPAAKRLSPTVRLHRCATIVHDQTLHHLCEELTATETVYPGTDLRLVYELVGEPPPKIIPPEPPALPN